MNSEEFEEWWFDGGEEEAIGKYDKLITEADIKEAPSYKLSRNRENAYVEAIWAKAYIDMVTHKLCEHKDTITIRRELSDLEGFPRSEDVKWCKKCGSLWEWVWEDGARTPRWIKPSDRK